MPKPYKKKEQEIVEEDKRYGNPPAVDPRTTAKKRDDVVTSSQAVTVPTYGGPYYDVETDDHWATYPFYDDGNPDQDIEGQPQTGGWSASTFPYTVPEPKGNGGTQTPESNPTADITSSPYWLAEMRNLYGQLGSDKFKFDLNGEELYQQYRDQYLRNGRLAMMDTMGQAAGLTGGYGSSYAQQVGQQTYQGYVNDLNAIVPNVYSAAYQRWRDEQGDKLDRYKLASSMYGITSDAENAEADRKASLEKAEIEAGTQRAKDEYQYRIDAAKLEQSRVDSLLKSGDWAYASNGDLVYIGRYIVNGNDVMDKVDLAVQDYFNKMTAQGNEAFNSAMSTLEGIAVSSNTDVAEVIADVILQQNGWDATYRPDVLNYVREMLKED